MSLTLFAAALTAVSTLTVDARSVYERVQGGVVTVRTTSSVGSGFVINDGTLVVTCQHVIKGETASVKVMDQNAEVLAEDAAADIAILRVPKRAGKSLAIAAGLPKPGTKVYAIGNPLGMLEKTISEGIVSAVRKIQSYEILQITAAVSEGSSGGPVVDESGSVVGMVSLGFDEGQALNFAVSAPMLRQATQTATKSKTRPATGSSSQSTAVQQLKELIRQVGKNEKTPEELTRYGSAAIPHIITALDEQTEDGDFNGYLVQALLEFGEPAKAPIIQALTKGTPRQRRAMAGLMNLVAEFTSPASSRSSDEPTLQEMMAERRKGTFKFIDDAEVKQALLKAYQTYDSNLGADAAVRALGFLDHKDLKKEILAGTSQSDSDVAAASFEALLAILGAAEFEDAKRAFDAVFAGTTKEDLDEDKFNARVENMSGSLRRNRTVVGVALIDRLLAHENWEVRYEMCNVLTERMEVSALPAVKKLLDDDSELIRWIALAAVGNLGRGQMLDKMTAYSKSSSSKDREWGIYAAGLTRTAGGLEVVLSRIADTEASVRVQVANSLSLFGDPKAIEALKKLAKDPDADVRKAAEEALGEEE